MSISHLVEKIKSFYFLFLFVVIAGIFFALGRLSAIEERHSPIKIVEPANGETASAISAISDQTGDAALSSNSSTSAGVSATSGEVVASKTGTKYFFPWCGGVKLIKPENLISFASAELAKAAGYTPAANCKGLQ